MLVHWKDFGWKCCFFDFLHSRQLLWWAISTSLNEKKNSEKTIHISDNMATDNNFQMKKKDWKNSLYNNSYRILEREK